MDRNGNRIATLGLVLSAIAIAAAMGAGGGVRLALWDFRKGFRILNWAAYCGIAGTAVSLAGANLGRPGRGRRGFLPAVAGILLGAVAFGVPAYWYRTAKSLPKIHDISTDTEYPPVFVSVLPLRSAAPNSAAYGGPEIAALQHAAYPDILPLVSDLPSLQAYQRARAVARKMCWKIVGENPAEGRIEATATTRWFGFKDDIVIRITPSGSSGSRVDVRSVSRVGLSDVGTNARRIRAFLEKFASASKTG